tara:strand:+ start:27 stop:233 length:207 start_codon:yes stop_codon:yes gene_type:complete
MNKSIPISIIVGAIIIAVATFYSVTHDKRYEMRLCLEGYKKAFDNDKKFKDQKKEIHSICERETYLIK